MTKFNKTEYDTNYSSSNITRLNISLNKKYDKDIIDFLDSLENKSDVVKRIIRNYIANCTSTGTNQVIDDLKKLIKKYEVKKE